MGHSEKLQYREDIDVLRGLSVIVVVLFHYQIPFFGNGYVGVDIFFVISGFLITKIIAAENEKGRFSYSNFLARRVKRLLPTLYILLASVIIYSLLFLNPLQVRLVAEQVLATIFFASNWYFANNSGYFGAESGDFILLHTWSLAIEEQFYLVWPVSLLLLHRFRQSLKLSIFFPIMVAAMFGLSIWMNTIFPDSAFYLTQARVWELLAGCALGLLLPASGLNKTARIGATLVGAVLLLSSLSGVTAPVLGSPSVRMIAAISAVFFIAAGQGVQFPGTVRLLWKPMLVFGLWSYSLYLWHWAILVAATSTFGRPLTLIETLGFIILSVVVSAMLYNLVETPARRTRLRNSHVLVIGAGAGLAMAAVALSLLSFSGFDNRSQDAVDRMATYIGARNPLRPSCHVADSPDWTPETCAIGIEAEGAFPDVLILGDSHADHWTPGLDVVLRQRGLSGAQLSGSSCVPIFNVILENQGALYANCARMMDNIVERLDELQEPTTIIVTARWSFYYEGGQFGVPEEEETFFLTVRGEGHDGVRSSSQALFLSGLLETVRLLSERGHRVILLGQGPEFSSNQANCTIEAILGSQPVECGPNATEILERINPANQVVASVAAEAGVRYVDATEALCDADRCQLMRDGIYLYWDDNHFNAEGARLVTPAVFLGIRLDD
jgi:peptidoglycan/LPS O-acetylase OafA/YrhL